MKRPLFIIFLIATIRLISITAKAEQLSGYELKGSVYTSDSVTAENATVMLPRSTDSVFMTVELKEVQVTGHRAPIKLMSEKLIFKPGNSTAKGNMAQLLPRLPGVQLSSTGELSLNGKKGVVLYLDNRKQVLSGDQLVVLLNSLDSEHIEEIELIDNPSVEYEAEGIGGIIRINRKKDHTSGEQFFVSTNLGQGRYGNGSISGRYEFQKGAFYLMADANYYNRKEQNDLFLYRTYDKESYAPTRTVDQSFYRTQTNKGYTPSLRMEHQLSEKMRIGLETNWNHNNFKVPIHAVSEFSSPEAIDSTRMSNSTMQISQNRLSNNLYLLYSPSPERELSINFDFIYYRAKGKTRQHTYLLQESPEPETASDFYDDSRNQVVLYALQADYRYALSKRSTLKAGARTNLSKLNQQNRYNRHTYDEWISGIYLSAETRKGPFSLQGGVRGELTQVNGDTLMDRSYFNFFPFATLGYEYSEKGSLSLQYTLRIKRPGYNQLNPQIDIFDNYTLETGNPLLREELSHTFSLTWMYRNKLRVTPYYNRRTDAITKNYILRENGSVIILPENLPKAWETGIRLNIMNLMPARFWQCNVYLNGYYRAYTFHEDGAERRHGKSSLIGQVNNHFFLPGGVCVEISGNLYTPFTEGRAQIKGGGELWCGISKNFCQDRLQVTLMGRDLLATVQEGLNVEIGGAHTEATSRQDKRRIELSVSWSLNRGKKWKNSERQPRDNENNRINL